MDNREQYVRQSYTELNPLTGLYYNRAFFKRADELLNDNYVGLYAVVAIDIAHFRMFNKSYGREEGDRLLVYIANCLKKVQNMYGSIAGYLGGDNFCVIMPDSREAIQDLESDILKGFQNYNNLVEFYPVFGVYSIKKLTEKVVTMYDCATIALSNTVGIYANRICWYDSGMEEQLEDELELLTEIQAGLEKGEFTFYAQPQCNISNGKIVGAESLVRWKHETKGMIPPGVFIPILEKNGLIAELDLYVWKRVCRWLRDWMDKGHHPVPISINVSRVDILSMDVMAYLQQLLREYRLSEKLLKIEITESAYSENNDIIVEFVNALRERGFTVMMDDFGSGYSSLNMLQHVSVDVIKLDMRFLDIDEKETDKGIGILESVINMAKMMRLPIIVEGVETQKQEKMLWDLGCRYIQGYYYYKPLPIEEFETLLADEQRLDFEGVHYNQEDSKSGFQQNAQPKGAIPSEKETENAGADENNRDMPSEEEMERRANKARALNHMSDGFFIYQADEKETILYANPRVVEIFGCKTLEEFMTLVKGSFRGMVHPEDYNRISKAITHQIETSGDNMDFIQYRIIRKDGQVRWLDDFGHLEDHRGKTDVPLFYVFISDMTEQIEEDTKKKLLDSNNE